MKHRDGSHTNVAENGDVRGDDNFNRAADVSGGWRAVGSVAGGILTVGGVVVTVGGAIVMLSDQVLTKSKWATQ